MKILCLLLGHQYKRYGNFSDNDGLSSNKGYIEMGHCQRCGKKRNISKKDFDNMPLRNWQYGNCDLVCPVCGETGFSWSEVEKREYPNTMKYYHKC